MAAVLLEWEWKRQQISWSPSDASSSEWSRWPVRRTNAVGPNRQVRRVRVDELIHAMAVRKSQRDVLPCNGRRQVYRRLKVVGTDEYDFAILSTVGVRRAEASHI